MLYNSQIQAMETTTFKSKLYSQLIYDTSTKKYYFTWETKNIPAYQNIVSLGNLYYGAKEVTLTELSNIIDTKERIGRFYAKEGEVYLGVDNQTGVTLVEDFESYTACMEWLGNDFKS